MSIESQRHTLIVEVSYYCGIIFYIFIIIIFYYYFLSNPEKKRNDTALA